MANNCLGYGVVSFLIHPIGSIFSEPRDATSLLRPTASEAAYCYVIENERLADSYEMHLDYKKAWVSVATLQRRRLRTTLMVSEQGVFLDGYDDAGSREQGTGQTDLSRVTRGMSPRAMCDLRMAFHRETSKPAWRRSLIN